MMAATGMATVRAASPAKVAQKDLAAKAADHVAKAVVTDVATVVDGVDVAAETVKVVPSASALTPRANPCRWTPPCSPVRWRKRVRTAIARSRVPTAALAMTVVTVVIVATARLVVANAPNAPKALNAASHVHKAVQTQRPQAKATARVAMKASPVKAVAGAVDADATDVGHARTTIRAQPATPASRPSWDSRTTPTPQALHRMKHSPRKTEMPRRKNPESTMANPVRSAHVTAMAVNADRVVSVASARSGLICASLRSLWRPKRTTCKRQACPQRSLPRP